MPDEANGTLRQRIDLAGHIAIRTRAFFDIWWIYDGASTRPRYLDTMNEYSEFFRFDEHAHFVSMVTYLAQLFENRTDTLNLGQLIRDTETLIPLAVGPAQSKFSRAKHLAPKVAILRSNLFAHRSLKISYADTFKLAEITPNQFRELTEIALAVVNELAAVVGIADKMFHSVAGSHAQAMLEALGKA
jgi:hypothetical protein